MATTKNRTLSTVLTTSNQNVYVAPTLFKADIDSILITNDSSSAVSVTMEWYSIVLNTYYKVLGTVSIRGNSVLQIERPLGIDQQDSIRALASTAGVITVTITATETYTTSTL